MKNRNESWNELGDSRKRYRGPWAEIYMLFAGWEVRMVKNCDRDLENTARGRKNNKRKY